MEKLSNKQLRFIEEYMIDCNGTQAAIRAGYSPKTANEQAARMLAKVSVKEEINKRKAELSQKAKKTREDIIDDLTRVVDEFLLDGRNTAHALKAIEILNKMVGWNEADKTDITTNGQSIIPPTINVKIIKPKDGESN